MTSIPGAVLVGVDAPVMKNAHVTTLVNVHVMDPVTAVLKVLNVRQIAVVVRLILVHQTLVVVMMRYATVRKVTVYYRGKS